MSRFARKLAGVALLGAIASLTTACCCDNPWQEFLLDDSRTNISVTGSMTMATGGATLIPITNGSLVIDTSSSDLELVSVSAWGLSSDTVPTKTPSSLPFYSSSSVGPTHHSLGAAELAPAPDFNPATAGKYVVWLRIQGIKTSVTPAAPLTLFAYRSATPGDWASPGAFTLLE